MNGKAGLSKQIKPEMFAGRQHSPGHCHINSTIGLTAGICR
jgi:hypothetical protein